jgi:hypothetical protein
VKSSYEKEEYRTVVVDLEGNRMNEDSITFNGQITNISQGLDLILDRFQNEHLVEVTLVTDGIFNRGVSPIYKDYPFVVNTIGVGDTVPKKDIRIESLKYNRVAFQGNRYPLEVGVFNEGLRQDKVPLVLKRGSKIIARKELNLQEDGYDVHSFLIDADSSGIDIITAEINAIPVEYNKQNNVRRAYVEVIDARQRILLAASAPHPDIRAINQALGKDDNFEVVLYIYDENVIGAQPYDLVITHNLPSRANDFPEPLKKQLEEGTPLFAMVGPTTNLSRFRQSYGMFPETSSSPDEIFVAVDETFTSFSLGTDFISELQNYPPIFVPFGNYSVSDGQEVVFKQQVGSLVTSKPQFVLGSKQGTKYGLFAGEGIWRWRLNEFQRNGSATNFDEFVYKVVQFLSSKEDKKRLRVYPDRREYFENEQISLLSEFYNEIYEPVYEQKISLEIFGDSIRRSFSFNTQQFNPEFRVTGLGRGRYNYVATTSYKGQQFSSQGSFLIKELNIENQTLTANHGLLRELARRSDGLYIHWLDVNSLLNHISDSDYKPILYNDYQLKAIIDLKWVFVVLFVLLALEWFLRKFYGSY